MSDAFTPWHSWSNRFDLPGLAWPGVYVIAISESDVSGEQFSWREDIAYIGMTNSTGGLRQRLGQFDQTIRGKEGHGGAVRFRYKHAGYDGLASSLYVAVLPFECNVRSSSADDLRVMGEVAAFEYECLARYVERYGRLPEFNDKKRSPKK